MRLILKLVALVVVAVGSLIVTLRSRRLAREQDHGGCVACGSADVEIQGQQLRCASCGYTGQADGGGSLTHDEVGSVRLDR